MKKTHESILNKGLKGEIPYKSLHKEISNLLDSIQDGIYITDGRCNTIKINKAWSEISGLNEKDVIGKHMGDLVEDGVCSQSVSLLVAEHRKAVSLIHKLKSGRNVLITGTPIKDDQDNINTIVTTVRDMDELNKLKLELEESKKKNRHFQQQIDLLRQKKEKDVIGNSKKLKETIIAAKQVATYPSTVLITGESGVGKEVIAQKIHKYSDRKGAFVSVNCGAIPENLLESELFGYSKGAFTGANTDKMGMIEAANHGTLFLDEVADLPKQLQVKILRFMQNKSIKPLGQSKEIEIDVRIIAATNRDLPQMVKRVEFREDLYYRLNVIPIEIPPLRKRKEDIIPLAEHFITKLSSKNKAEFQLTADAKEALLSYPWPGNVRELENVIERTLVLTPSNKIAKEQLKLPKQQHTEKNCNLEKTTLQQRLQSYEKEIIAEALKQHGTTREIASHLGISQTSVVRKIKKYNLN